MYDLNIKIRLDEFADYLDNLPGSLDKGKLSKFFTGYTECYNKLCLYKHINRDKDVYIWKI